MPASAITITMVEEFDQLEPERLAAEGLQEVEFAGRRQGIPRLLVVYIAPGRLESRIKEHPSTWVSSVYLREEF